MSNPIVEQASALFGQVQQLAINKGSIKEARRLTAQIASLARKIAKTSPNTTDHADAVSWLGYAFLNMAGLSPRKKTQDQLQTEGYQIEAEAVSIRLHGKLDRGVAFAAYNLGIDLCFVQKQPADALHWLNTSRKIINRVPKEQVPFDFRLTLNRGIAQCEYDLGNKAKAARILRATLGKRRPKLSNWSELRGFAHCQQLLAQIILDGLTEKRAKSKS